MELNITKDTDIHKMCVDIGAQVAISLKEEIEKIEQQNKGKDFDVSINFDIAIKSKEKPDLQ